MEAALGLSRKLIISLKTKVVENLEAATLCFKRVLYSSAACRFYTFVYRVFYLNPSAYAVVAQ